MCELITIIITQKKKKKEKAQAENDLSNILHKYAHARKKPPPPPPLDYLFSVLTQKPSSHFFARLELFFQLKFRSDVVI